MDGALTNVNVRVECPDDTALGVWEVDTDGDGDRDSGENDPRSQPDDLAGLIVRALRPVRLSLPLHTEQLLWL
jgi:hypothetical protein